MKFTCIAYPFLRVLIERSGNKVGGDRFAEFRFGNYETNDEKEIEILRATPFVHEDAKIDFKNLTVEVSNDDLITAANLTAGGMDVVLPDRRRLTSAERAAQRASMK
jgi:hypothetical protein